MLSSGFPGTLLGLYSLNHVTTILPCDNCTAVLSLYGFNSSKSTTPLANSIPTSHPKEVSTTEVSRRSQSC